MLKGTLFPLFFFIYSFTFSQDNIKIITWNIEHFGDKKTPEQLDSIAEILQFVDIVAIQEVGTLCSGEKAVDRLLNILNRKGDRWDCIFSQPTNSISQVKERYAFFWKTGLINIKTEGRLIHGLDSLVGREPYSVDFYKNDKILSVLSLHLNSIPEKAKFELKAVTRYLKNANLQSATMLLGDFNLDEKLPAFNALKSLGFSPAISYARTTLKESCKGSIYLCSAFDNIFYSQGIQKSSAHVANIVVYCDNLPRILKLSDHLPVYMEFSF